MATMIRTTKDTRCERWELGENETMRLPHRHGATVVRVERGTVLVTRGGDRDDHVLEPGDELVLPRRGLAVAWSFTPAVVSVRDGLRVIAREEDAVDAPAAAPAARATAAREPQEAEEAEEIEVAERLGAEVAHELKNPIAAVKALAQLGLRSPAETRSHPRLRLIEREVGRMQEILQRYLSAARRPGVRLERIELGPLVSDVLLALSATACEAEVRLSSQGSATIEADRRRLEGALLNLVSNAIEATPPGGAVVVELRQAGDGAEIAVRDTGRGMPTETLSRLGTPFFTTRDEGTGLGVALARAVFADHGGWLRYESEQGRGTTVRARLPGHGARGGAAPPGVPPAA